ncbi:hypothetical protein [Oceanicoccus sagamiensis]|uniref:Uncharacterized protein n=1 Tax=Oceanicoccus sagamiensis TaxID=716816 RepID=A0A1X9NH18_9GAMM|nr:hypothetical protein [Oceanicoccus sagamiensis]ARN75135.1 hypothetical protein BST96_14025 [Oceanicoccus sagamiensis]
MFKPILVLAALTLSLCANSTIVSHGDLLSDDSTDSISDTVIGREYKRLDSFDLSYAETLLAVREEGIYQGWNIADSVISGQFIAAAPGGQPLCSGHIVLGTVCGTLSGPEWSDGDFGDSFQAGTTTMHIEPVQHHSP